jgi:hypothetical protein
MTITSNEYEVLKRSVAKIYETSDLVKSLKSRAKDDADLSAVIHHIFSDDVIRCAEFVKKHSNIQTSISADINIIEARLSAYFSVRKELTRENVNDFIDHEFSFAHVDSHDYAILDIEHADMRYKYEMQDFESVSRAA